MLGGGVMKGPLCWRKLYRNGPFRLPGRPPPPQDTPRPFKQGATGTTGGGGQDWTWILDWTFWALARLLALWFSPQRRTPAGVRRGPPGQTDKRLASVATTTSTIGLIVWFFSETLFWIRTSQPLGSTPVVT